ncbi:MAG TPA: aldehyde dehydrogenase family protein [Anaeromyxobacter sp.]|nr:aldehyde dehydrogenase family protein [Anaeromyxobacter sp.]
MTDVPVRPYYLDGKWERSASGDGFIEVENPATELIIGRVPRCGAAEVDRAVKAARRAFPLWRGLTPHRRAEYLRAAGGALAERRDEVARTVTAEMGKPLDEARGEVDKVVKTFLFYAEEAVRVLGQTIPNDEPGFCSMVQREPVGVAAAIAPWNYPVELLGWKLGGGLAAGCTLVLKPASKTPMSAVALVECFDAAHLPPGVVNLLTGDSRMGEALITHPDVDKIAFTGSQEVGERIFRIMGGIKSVALELGGNCPLIVAPHANLAAAVKGAVRRSFRNMGQICVAINRVYVHRPLYPAFLEGVSRSARALTIADGLERPSADLGPMADQGGVAKTKEHIEDALQKGARLVCGGKRPAGFPKGHFFEPTVLADCTPEMLIMNSETFGPVIGVSPFDALEEAIRLSNDSPMGLVAYAYSEDLAEVFALSGALAFGSVGINCVDAGIIGAPYGGRRKSGIGYEHGREGMEGYLVLKHVRIRHGLGGQKA